MKSVGSIVAVLIMALLARADDVGALIKQLQSKDVEVRRDAATQLSDAGKNAKEAIPALTSALSDKDKFVRRFAAKNVGHDRLGRKAPVRRSRKLVSRRQSR